MRALLFIVLFLPISHAESLPPQLERFEKHFSTLAKENQRTFKITFGYGEHLRPKDLNGEWQIQVGQEVLQRKIPRDVFDLILCHELGHLAGGEPREILRTSKGSKPGFSFEGQSDYFATKDCLPNLWQDEFLKDFKFEELPLEVITACGKFASESRRQICLRSNVAAFWWATNDLIRYERTDQIVVGRKLSFLTPEEARRLPDSLSAHPNSQCRLDTFYAGSVQQNRPACWFVEN